MAEPAHSIDTSSPATNVIKTRRMTLRELAFGDAQALIDLDADPRVRRYLIDDPVDSPTRALLLIDHVQALYADGCGLGIWRADDPEQNFLGYFSLMRVAAPHRDAGMVEIGVRLHPRAWGHFYALEGGRALCHYAFETLRLPALAGYCDPGNRVVSLLLRRLGFKDTGVTTHFARDAKSFRLSAPRPS